jgi:DNA-binding transcriptional MerR regulator
MGAEGEGVATMSIKDVSRLLGLPIPTIRSWERRYGFPTPLRTAGQHRRYGTEELTQLRALRDEIAHGRPVSEAVDIVRESDQKGPHLEVRARLIASWRRFDADNAKRLLDEGAKADLDALIQLVLLPALREVGHLWQAGKCDVAEEHFATSQARSWLLGQAFPPPIARRRPGTAILACGPEELHTVGLDAFATLLVRGGIGVKVLGALTPTTSLVTAVQATNAEAVVVTCQRGTNRRATVRSLVAVSELPGVKLFYAGNAFATERSRAEVPGLYLGADLPEAREVVIATLGKRSEDAENRQPVGA